MNLSLARRILPFILSMLAAASAALAADSAPPASPAARHPGTETHMTTPTKLQSLAEEFYLWRYDEYPVWSTDSGRHTADDKLADYSAAAIARRQARVKEFRARFEALPEGTSLDERVDRKLFGSTLARAEFQQTVLRNESRDPQTYVDECSNAIFSLLKKDFAPHAARVKFATARMRAMPALLEQGKKNLTEPVGLYADLAMESAGGIGPLFTESLESLTKGVPDADVRAMHEARDAALKAIASYAAWLKERRPAMKNDFAMGKKNYAHFLEKVLLLPISPDEVVALGEAELARSRATQAWLASAAARAPKPTPPRDQEGFLKGYEARTAEIVTFLHDRKILTVPEDTGPFYIRQLPEAFKPTSPGGF